MFRFEVDAAMVWAIASTRLWLGIKGRTKIIFTAATVNDFQLRNLGS